MKLIQGNQAFANFIAIATATAVVTTSTTNNGNNKNNSPFVSARIGGSGGSSSSQQHVRKAPTKIGYDPTAPVIGSTTTTTIEQQPLRNKQVPDSPSKPAKSRHYHVLQQLETKRRSSSTRSDSNNDHAELYERPGTSVIDDSLRIQMEEVKKLEAHPIRIRNATTTGTNTTDNDNMPIINKRNGCYNDPDTGVLICGSSSSKSKSSSSSSSKSSSLLSSSDTPSLGTPSGTPSRKLSPPSLLSETKTKTTKTTTTADDDTASATSSPPPPSLLPEGEDAHTHHIQCKIGHIGDQYSKLMKADQFMRETNGQYYGMSFDPHTQLVICNGNCSKMIFEDCDVKCNGEKSCYQSRIHDADNVECNGVDSCAGAHIDSYHVSCNAERSCQESYIGDNQFTYTLNCLAHESCSWATTSQVDDVHCSGPAACYGAYLGGVESRVLCQSLPHEEGYYSPTCGGDKGFIEAEKGKSIQVTCNGDFACIGYGHDPYDDTIEHPIYFDVDVGNDGELNCEGSFAGNHDGGTYVCRYIDIIQGCSNYSCHEPTGFNENNDYRTCNHIFSIHHHELCYEGPGGHYTEQDEDDDEYEDEDEDEVDDEDDDDDEEEDENEDDTTTTTTTSSSK